MLIEKDNIGAFNILSGLSLSEINLVLHPKHYMTNGNNSIDIVVNDRKISIFAISDDK